MRIPVIRLWPTWTPLLPWTFRNPYRLFLQPAKHTSDRDKNTPHGCQNADCPCTPPTLFPEHARASTRSVADDDDGGGVRWTGILTIVYRYGYGRNREKHETDDDGRVARV